MRACSAVFINLFIYVFPASVDADDSDLEGLAASQLCGVLAKLADVSADDQKQLASSVTSSPAVAEKERIVRRCL